MAAKILWQIGSAIFTFMGVLHLYLTFKTNRLYPSVEDTISKMKNDVLNLSSEANLWKAWIGFNASHSAGIVFIGIVNIYLAWKYFDILRQDWIFPLLTIIAISFYLWLAWNYWFKGVATMLTLALLILLVGWVIMLIQKSN